MPTTENSQNQNLDQPEVTEQVQTPVPHSTPKPGRVASYEQAKARAFRKYDKALRELAK